MGKHWYGHLPHKGLTFNTEPHLPLGTKKGGNASGISESKSGCFKVKRARDWPLCKPSVLCAMSLQANEDLIELFGTT